MTTRDKQGGTFRTVSRANRVRAASIAVRASQKTGTPVPPNVQALAREASTRRT